MKNTYLCGFMGCGKSTYGKKLAEKLGAEFVDLDDLIVQMATMTIPTVFELYGEEYFRTLETALIKELSVKNGVVVATGGGALVNPKNAEIAKANGIVLYLDVPFDICYSRIKDDKGRPLVVNNTKEQLETLYNNRKFSYEGNCDEILRYPF